MLNQNEIADWFKDLQDRICGALEDADGKGKFQEDLWERPGGGGGRTRILQAGAVIEKGGVNFSAVYGSLPDNIKQALGLTESNFFASGVSIVLHPNSPMVPIIHMNVRYFGVGDSAEWFGGGIDLTPHYVVDEDAKYFHRQLKEVCDKHHSSYYPDFKKWADEYFYIKHRKETRGVGGIFFDRLSEEEGITIQDRFAFVKDVGDAFAPIYTHLMAKNEDLPYTEKEKQWQLVRRGRYVEFNLVYDKGTKFGLDTDGRIESILMSLPKTAGWEYDFNPDNGTVEAETLTKLKKGLNWLG